MFRVNKPLPKIKSVKSSGVISIVFNNKMIFPDDFEEQINSRNNRRLRGDKELIEIELQASYDSDESLLNFDWQVIESSETELNIKLQFQNPLEVSQNDDPEIVKIRLNFEEFTDEYGQSMDSTLLWVILPRLLLSQ